MSMIIWIIVSKDNLNIIDDDFEAIWIEIKNNKSKNIVLLLLGNNYNIIHLIMYLFSTTSILHMITKPSVLESCYH